MKKLFFALFLPCLFSLSAAEMVTVTERNGDYLLSVAATAGVGKTARDSRITGPLTLVALRNGAVVHRAAVTPTPGGAPGGRTGRIYLPDRLAWDTLTLHRNLPSWRGMPLAALPPQMSAPLARIDRVAVRPAALAPLYPFEKIQETGNDDRRIVWVIMGDGYTAAEMEKFKNDVDTALDGFFASPPWKRRREAFNIYRVDVVSNESGADHLELDPPTFADTALGAEFGCWGTARALCVDEGAVQEIAASVAPYDFVMVIVNDDTYGGIGGPVTVASTHSLTVDLVLHEFGHTFGKLADEYEDEYPGYPVGDWEPNVSYAYDFDREKIVWSAWIADDTPLPTPENDGYYDIVGMFEGARYLTSGIYRPKEQCMMRMLGNPFCPVCVEAQAIQVYNLAAPLQKVAPKAGTIDYAPGLAVTVEKLPCDAVNVVFTLNGEPVTGADCDDTGCALTIPEDALKNGENNLRALVADETGEIRTDPEQLSRSTVQWEIIYEEKDIKDEKDIRDEDEIADPDDIVKRDDGCSCSVVGF